MKKQLSCLLILILIAGCGKSPESVKEEDNGLEALAYTLYTGKTELFVEFKPLVVGEEAKFAAHFTVLGDSFKAITKGSVTLSLEGRQPVQSIKADSPSNPGIFRLALKPQKAGQFKLVFDIQTPLFTDRVTIDSVTVYSDLKTALSHQENGAGGGNEITYLKEQAWKIEFANLPVFRISFSDVVKTSGIILSAQGDEQTIPAKASGTISFTGKNLLAGSPVSAGQMLFSISSKGYVDNNANVKLQEAKSSYEKSKADYERNQSLVNERLITQKEFLQSKAEFESSQAWFNSLSGNYGAGGQTITATQGGFIKSLMVSEGQFVEAGQSLAVISKNKRLVIKADVSPTSYSKIAGIASANFKAANGQVYSLHELNGKVASIGQATDNSLFIPVFFEVDNREGLIPGTFVEVFIKTNATSEGLVIPVSAIMEDQGSYYCYVQTAGESFEKRDLLINGNDGKNVRVVSGISEGERVVTKGAYNIKLSVASGALPAHGHEH